MKKKIILLLSSMLILVSGCGNNTKTVDLTQSPDTESESIAVETQEETEQKEKLFDKDVDIILSMISVGDTDIDTYVEEQKNNDPDGIYAVYDDFHYTYTIKESKRKELVENFKNEDYINDAFKDIFSDEQYNGAFLSMDYDDMFRNVTFYVDKNAYDNAGIAAALGPVFVSGVFADSAQAYNLVPPEERSCTVKIVDNDTKEVIYDSSEDTSSTEE